MANSQIRTPRLKPLLDKVPPGFLVDTAWLKAQGIESKSIHRYASHGWLEHIVHGVYRRPVPRGVQEDTLITWESVLLSLQRILNCNVHLGGVSALDLAGFQRYLYLGGTPQVHVYGSVPSWVKRLPIATKIVVHRKSLFGDDLVGVDESGRDVRTYDEAVHVWRWSIRASSPERAVLEAMDLLQTRVSFENLDLIFQSLITLRPNLLNALLEACRSVKVRRLFFVFAERHGRPWLKHLDESRIDFGSGPRALIQGGRIHPVYRIYVPPEFAKKDTR